MGWTGQYFHGVKNTTQKFKEIIFDDYGKDKTLYIYNVGNTFYCAVKRDGIIYGLVVLCRRNGNEFAVKYQSECVHPFYYGANAKLLAMLTPTQDNYCLEWRENCHKEIEKKKSIQKPKVGDVLVFETPLTFGRLGEHKRVRKEEKYFSVLVFGEPQLVNIPPRFLKDTPYTIL